jgi:hypothetical protein
MEDLERRLIVLEQRCQHDREMTGYRLADISRQLQELQSRPLSQLSAGGLIKITIAILLPLFVWLVTGDLRKALEASRLAGG